MIKQINRSLFSVLILCGCLISYSGNVVVVKTNDPNAGYNFMPDVMYDEYSQEFTIDFGEVDEISSGRVVIHDDSGGYQVKNFLVTPACHEFTFICPMQGTLYITITTPHGDTYAGTTGN